MPNARDIAKKKRGYLQGSSESWQSHLHLDFLLQPPWCNWDKLPSQHMLLCAVLQNIQNSSWTRWPNISNLIWRYLPNTVQSFIDVRWTSFHLSALFLLSNSFFPAPYTAISSCSLFSFIFCVWSGVNHNHLMSYPNLNRTNASSDLTWRTKTCQVVESCNQNFRSGSHRSTDTVRHMHTRLHLHPSIHPSLLCF